MSLIQNQPTRFINNDHTVLKYRLKGQTME